MYDNEIPGFWLEAFPKTYLEYIPMRDEFSVKVFYYVGDEKRLYDWRMTVEESDRLQVDRMYKLMGLVGRDFAKHLITTI